MHNGSRRQCKGQTFVEMHKSRTTKMPWEDLLEVKAHVPKHLLSQASLSYKGSQIHTVADEHECGRVQPIHLHLHTREESSVEKTMPKTTNILDFWNSRYWSGWKKLKN